MKFIITVLKVDLEYHNAKERFRKQLNELKEKEKLWKKSSTVLTTYEKGLKKLQGFDIQYINSDIEQKRRLLGSIFPEKFQFEKNKV